MIPQIIQLAIYIAVFLGAVFLAVWLCDKFSMPQWVKWIVGGILLIILLLFIGGQFGGSGASFNLFPSHR